LRRLARPLITLLSDFGISDHYAAAMKGTMLQMCGELVLVDISHSVRRHSIMEGAYLLVQSTPYFPEGAVHIAVVDPGVGTKRRRLAIEGTRSFYVGPDNGVLIPAARAEGIVRVVSITNRDYMLRKVSSTFEGRDVFAPVAVHLSLGLNIETLGPEISDPVEPAWTRPEKMNHEVRGVVVQIDHFGNLVTNIPAAYVGQWQIRSTVEVLVRDIRRTALFAESYAEADEGGLVVLVGSSGLVEIAVYGGSAESLLSAELADSVTIHLVAS